LRNTLEIAIFYREHDRPMKKDDIIGLVGGLLCLCLSELDPGWGLFWFAVGILLIVWTLASMRKARPKP
jgi:hypothetical protein